MGDVSKTANLFLSQLLWVWEGKEVLIVEPCDEDDFVEIQWAPGVENRGCIPMSELESREDAKVTRPMGPATATAILNEAGLFGSKPIKVNQEESVNFAAKEFAGKLVSMTGMEELYQAIIGGLKSKLPMVVRMGMHSKIREAHEQMGPLLEEAIVEELTYDEICALCGAASEVKDVLEKKGKVMSAFGQKLIEKLA